MCAYVYHSEKLKKEPVSLSLVIVYIKLKQQIFLNMEKTRIIVIGCGVAGINFLLKLKQMLGESKHNLQMTIVESGSVNRNNLNLEANSNDDTEFEIDKNDSLISESPDSIINGFGGAGLYTDRKLSVFPSGMSLLNQNIYELKKSYIEIISVLKQAVPEYNSQLDELSVEIQSFLGEIFNSSEFTVKKVKDLQKYAHILKKTKFYKSFVLKKQSDSVKILKMFYDLFFEYFKKDKLHFDTTVVNIERENIKSDEEYRVTLKSNSTGVEFVLSAEKIIFANGRFGSLLVNNYINQTNKKAAQLKLPKIIRTIDNYSRFEYGVRLSLANNKMLLKKVQSMMECGKTSHINDLKIILKKEIEIFNRKVTIEYRTFAVCTDDRSYMIKATDKFSGLSTFSASSSIDEYSKISETNSKVPIFKGASIGIMVRITDKKLALDMSRLLFNKSTFKKLLRKDSKKFVLVLDPSKNASKNAVMMQSIFPYVFSSVLYQGINMMVDYILNYKNDSYDHIENDSRYVIFGPCIEGLGVYPDINRKTYQLRSDPNMYVIGDSVGYSRGLLSSMVMGNMCAKVFYNDYLFKTLLKGNVLNKYQDLSLINTFYGKTESSDLNISNWYDIKRNVSKALKQFIEQKMRDDSIYVSDINDINRSQTKMMIEEVMNHILKNKTVMDIAQGKAFQYEINNYFFDKLSMESTRRLHVLSENVLIQFMIVCNVINENLSDFANLILKETELAMPLYHFECWKENFNSIRLAIRRCLKETMFKSKIISKRIRKSIKDRHMVSDVPIMMSSLKFEPVPIQIYNRQYTNTPRLSVMSTLQKISSYLTSTMALVLNITFEYLISHLKLDLNMVRTTISVPETNAIPDTQEAHFYECKVKVDFKDFNGKSLMFTRNSNSGSDSLSSYQIQYNDEKIKTMDMLYEFAGVFERRSIFSKVSPISQIFNVMAVSNNLLKKEAYLTVRAESKEDIQFLRENIEKVLKGSLYYKDDFEIILNNKENLLRNVDDIECDVSTKCYLYDSNHTLDDPWFTKINHPLNENFTDNMDTVIDKSAYFSSLLENNK